MRGPDRNGQGCPMRAGRLIRRDDRQDGENGAELVVQPGRMVPIRLVTANQQFFDP